MNDLLAKKCIPCSIAELPLEESEINNYMNGLKTGWNVIDSKKIEKTYKFKDFKEGLDFTNKVGDLAESEGHHPGIFLTWGKVVISLMTHNIKGLHENDFIMAAKIDEIYG